ncbi:MAG: hypothetical protein ACQEQD_04385 [Bacillota bacterium]
MAVFNWFGDKVSKKEKEKAGRAQWLAAEALLTESNKSVPHDEGTLERSGVVYQEGQSHNPDSVYDEAKSGGNPKNNYKFDFKSDFNFRISYNTPYAVALHEAPAGQYNFRGKGQAKWLEKTAREMSNKLEKFVAEEIKKG